MLYDEDTKKVLKIAFKISSYISEIEKKRKEYLKLEIDKYITTYENLIELRNLSDNNNIEESITSIQRILADFEYLKEDKGLNKKPAHIKINGKMLMVNSISFYKVLDNELITFNIVGKRKKIKFSIRYTPRLDKYDKLKISLQGLKMIDLLKLLYHVLTDQLGKTEKESKKIIKKYFNRDINGNNLEYVAIITPNAVLNKPLTYLEKNKLYTIYWHLRSEAQVWNGLSSKNIEYLITENNLNYFL